MNTRWGGREERGFSLVELMVVVLIIAVLLAIAIPTFLGARDRANDRVAQSNLRIAHTNELVWIADNKNSFTEDIGELRALDASVDWTNQFSDVLARQRSVFVDLTEVNAHPAVMVGSRSRPGTCFWLRAVATEDHPRYARNDCVGTPAASEFKSSWN